MTDDDDLRERYRKTMPLLAELLHIQAGLISRLLLVDAEKVNAAALGYIYGLTDCAFQITNLDIGSEYGLGVLMALIMEFDEPNADSLFEYLKAPADAAAMMEGVKLGGEDYNGWVEAHGATPPLRWAKCFPF
jgi:hypothetical protein